MTGDRANDWPTGLPAWRALQQHGREVPGSLSLAALCRDDPQRFTRFSISADGLLLDCSRQLITAETLQRLEDLAREAGVEALRDRLFAGEHLNVSEDRAALHMALRARPDERYFDGDFAVTPVVHAVLDRVAAFVQAVHSGEHAGHDGRRITDVVNIGIGGSDLGVEMATRALANYAVPGLRVHCVSNIDGVALGDALARLEPATTLFVVCSKSFTTLETLTNARAARAWLVDRLGADAVARHFVGVSANAAAMAAFGIAPTQCFGFWDFVGGRFSLWSAAGLAIALGIGMEAFRALLAGGRAMDHHFRAAPLTLNLPVRLGLLSVWNRNFLGCASLAVLPYDSRLARLPAYLQQLHMESNGKGRDRNGAPVRVDTAPVIWGEPGSNAQHSFCQALHEGTGRVAVDFLAPVQGSGPSQSQHDLALVNLLAQSQALAENNRPSTTLLFRQLDPETLGKLVALYEHKVFVESVIWGINAFDQPGVESGKRLARELSAALARPGDYDTRDETTRGLLAAIARWR